ncbi:hypothetical protein NKJ72_29345 [Mesorhizobium sp. M0045]|uniref:hypothetical protein n=1 Tax=unclassified Mesorhizobium TaxID=325217 RepID=UPI003337F7FB
MDRDNKRARAAARSSQGVGSSSLRDVPEGPLSDVAERLVTANPRDTARNLGGFKGLGTHERTAVRGTQAGPETDLARFERRANQLGRSAIDLAEKLTAGLGYTPDDVALQQVRAVSNVCHYLTPGMQDAIVNRIGNMEPSSQALGALYVAPHFSKFNDENKSRILDQAIGLASDPDVNVKLTASNAILNAYHQFDANQQAQAHSVPGMQHILPHMPPPQHAAEERSANLDGHIAGIEAAVRDTVSPQTSYEQLQRGAQVGQSISHTYNHAREDLMEATRSRDRSGR